MSTTMVWSYWIVSRVVIFTPQNCYPPVFVEDIFTKGTQSSVSKRQEREKLCFSLLVVRNIAANMLPF